MPVKGFSDIYLDIRKKLLRFNRPPAMTSGTLVKESADITEKTLRCLWYDRELNLENLETSSRQQVQVFHPGEWNRGPGPDFIGAEIQINKKILRGDVEIHLSDRSWKTHGHDRDPAYNNVILHAYLHRTNTPARIQCQNKKTTASVCLADRLPNTYQTSDDYPFQSASGTGKCRQALSQNVLGSILRIAGDGRILLKAQKMISQKKQETMEDLLYKGLLEALGYHQNKKQMALLADRLPFAYIKKCGKRSKPLPAHDKHSLIEALLLGAAGFLEKPLPKYDKQTNQFLKKLIRLWKKFKPNAKALPPIQWTLHGIRPANAPIRRLSGLTHLLTKRLSSDSPFTLSPVLSPSAFVVPAKGYFARRSKWGGRPFHRPIALIGPARAQAIWVNAYLPLSVHLARQQHHIEQESKLHQIYSKLPLREHNSTARLMAHRLLGSESNRPFSLKKEYQQQALLQLFQDFCDIKPWACGHCALPKTVQAHFTDKN